MALRRYFDSMAGRLFIVLLVGITAAGGLAVAVSKHYRDRYRSEELANRVQDFVWAASTATPTNRLRLLQSGAPGLYPVNPQEKILAVDKPFSELLTKHLGQPILAYGVLPRTCFAETAVRLSNDKIRCWLIATELSNGQRLRLTLLSPKAGDFPLAVDDLLYLSLLFVGVGVLTFFVARMAAGPITSLANAARMLGEDFDALPLTVKGPSEVRTAITAFNTMRGQLRIHAEERTRILASITHDLQTPLTRLRLRLEKVPDGGLRSRLVDDLKGMQMLIREGLDFARGAQTDEPIARFALDNLLESLVDEAEEQGHAVTLAGACGCDVQARPRALQRCLGNLLDNAIKYGGSAEVCTEVQEDVILVLIRDRGPGVPAERLQDVFEPFVRLEGPQGATEGVGLGLTIARMMAERTNAALALANHPEGGLIATVRLRRNPPDSCAPDSAPHSDAG